MIKFLLQGNRYKTTDGEPTGVLGEAAVNLVPTLQSRQGFLDDGNRLERPLSDPYAGYIAVSP
jgi:hypothetical protein